MKKSVIYVSVVFVLAATLTATLTYQYNVKAQKDKFAENIETYLKENNYQRQVITNETMRDSKTGDYYAKVIFKDEPNNIYEIYEKGKGDFDVYGYRDGVEIIDRTEAKYITYQE